VNRTEAIQIFLSGANTPLAKLYNPAMECQVNVNSKGGKLVTGKRNGKIWRGYTDGPETWKQFRIPWNASGEPHFTDTPISWTFSEHVQAIGLTGWNWINRESTYVGFDIDSVINHKGGLSEKELTEIEKKCSNVPWLNLYRSTGGSGLHLYIHFSTPIPTKTHTEHAALARSLLPILTVKLGINFEDKTDCVGGILWILHEKIEGGDGLQPIYIGEKKFPNEYVDKNWKKHLTVTRKESKKTKLADPAIETLYASIKNIILRSEHKELLTWLDEKAKNYFWWDMDWRMLVCHTLDLKLAHEELKFQGLFKSSSTGSTSHNCFMFPISNGGWVVRRFGNNVKEHSSWIKDKKGWTKCYFNMLPSFEQAIHFYEGQESKGNEYVFKSPALLQNVLNSLNIKYSLSYLPDQEIRIKKTESKIYIKLPILKQIRYESDALLDFVKEKTYYIKVLQASFQTEINDTTLPDLYVRSTIAEESAAGWFIHVENKWVSHPENNVRTVLQTVYQTLKSKDITIHMGEALLNPWKLVNKPFQSEYTGDREWNKDAANLSVIPIQGNYPHWQKILDHIGSNLNEVIKKNPWFQQAGILTGADYLFTWIASMFQKPTTPLPYLFLTGGQNTGKSILHEALRLCFKGNKGYIRANAALENTQGFNGELTGIILAIVEEIDLRGGKAYDRIKDWVTGETLVIRALYKTSYEAINTLHFIQCSNHLDYCPVFPGDTRIVVIPMNSLTKVINEEKIETEIPKGVLLDLLEEELPYFLYDILDLDLPAPPGRLGLPILKTQKKKELEELNATPLEEFMEERCFYRKGHKLTWREFLNAFQLFLSQKKYNSIEINKWTEKRISANFPLRDDFPKGKHGVGHKVCIGNMSFDEEDEDLKTYFTKSTNGRRIECK